MNCAWPFEAAPGRAAFRLALARTLSDAKRFDEADAEYQRLLELEPQNADAHIGRGALSAERGQLDRAAAQLARGLDLQPRHHAARIYLADVLTRLGRHPQARVEYQRLIAGNDVPSQIRLLAQRGLQALDTVAPR
ncbi:MAG: tetratricopeptide repeat protein [Acidobacteria bacterium]|nr:tetratricopeptide repeat protein [Acidobacteriota bacterium]